MNAVCDVSPAQVAAPSEEAAAVVAAPARGRLTALGVYAGTMVVSVLATVGVLNLWRADLRVPFGHLADGLLYQALNKAILEHGWYLHNPSLGAPLGLDMNDFPLVDNLHFLGIKLIALVVRDSTLAGNLYYLLTFPLTALSSLFVLRRLACSYGPAVAGSLLFAFLPYHQMRLVHVMLAAYYLVPLAVLVALWIFQERVPFFHTEAVRARLTWRGRRTLGAVAVALLLAGGGVYYAYFACYFLAVAGLSAALYRRRLYPLVSAGLVIAVLVVAFLANYSPTLVYRWQHGPNPEAVLRQPAGAETYALKITQLLLPTSGHRLTRLRDFKADYTATAVVNESDSAALGLVGAAGFVGLVGWLFYRRREALGRGWIGALSLLNLAALLLATMGGFGSFLAYLGCSWIRGYCRISVYIGFFSLAAVALVLESIHRRHVRTRATRMLYAGLLGILAAVGILDQTTPRVLAPYEEERKEFALEGEFVHRIEASLPEGAMIFQMPYLRFPESVPVQRTQSYDHLRGYLHSRSLRWSHASIAGDEGDAWARRVSAEPVPEMVQTLAYAGFGGIWLDRWGYADNGADMEGQFARLLGTAPLVSANQRWAFYPLADHAERLRQACTSAAWETKQDDAVNGIRVLWRGAFLPAMPVEGHLWRDCGPRGEIHLINPSRHPRTVELSLCCASLQLGSTLLRIESDLFSTCLEIDPRPKPLTTTITVPPGRHVIAFTCPGTPLHVPGLFQDLSFGISDFTVKEQAPK